MDDLTWLTSLCWGQIVLLLRQNVNVHSCSTKPPHGPGILILVSFIFKCCPQTMPSMFVPPGVYTLLPVYWLPKVGLDWTWHMSFLTGPDWTPKLATQILPDRSCQTGPARKVLPDRSCQTGPARQVLPDQTESGLIHLNILHANHRLSILIR